MLIVYTCEIWIILKLCPPVPFASKSGGHVPQLLWERRSWLLVTVVIATLCIKFWIHSHFHFLCYQHSWDRRTGYIDNGHTQTDRQTDVIWQCVTKCLHNNAVAYCSHVNHARASAKHVQETNLLVHKNTSNVTGCHQGPKWKLRAGYRAPSLKRTSCFHRRVWYRALSVRYAYIRRSGIILIS